MIEDVEIRWDEDGAHVRLVGDLSDECARYLADPNADALDVRLDGDAVVALAAAARLTLQPWVDDLDHHRRLYDATRRDPDDDGSFEGIGNFDGNPVERHAAHQAAKGRA